jgi:hypothetical protein
MSASDWNHPKIELTIQQWCLPQTCQKPISNSFRKYSNKPEYADQLAIKTVAVMTPS